MIRRRRRMVIPPIDHEAMLEADADRFRAQQRQGELNMADDPEEWLKARYRHLAEDHGRPFDPIECWFWFTLWAAWRAAEGRRDKVTFPLADKLFWASDHGTGWLARARLQRVAGQPYFAISRDIADLADMDFLTIEAADARFAKGIQFNFSKMPPLGIRYAVAARD